GHAVDGGDDRLGHVAHAENGRMVKGAKQLAGTHLAVRGPGGIEVGARAEPTTRAGDQDGANGLVAAGTLDRGAEGGDQLRRDRVEHVGAVEGDAGDAVGRLVKDGFAHDWSPFWLSCDSVRAPRAEPVISRVRPIARHTYGYPERCRDELARPGFRHAIRESRCHAAYRIRGRARTIVTAPCATQTPETGPHAGSPPGAGHPAYDLRLWLRRRTGRVASGCRGRAHRPGWPACARSCPSTTLVRRQLGWRPRRRCAVPSPALARPPRAHGTRRPVPVAVRGRAAGEGARRDCPG